MDMLIVYIVLLMMVIAVVLASMALVRAAASGRESREAARDLHEAIDALWTAHGKVAAAHGQEISKLRNEPPIWGDGLKMRISSGEKKLASLDKAIKAEASARAASDVLRAGDIADLRARVQGLETGGHGGMWAVDGGGPVKRMGAPAPAPVTAPEKKAKAKVKAGAEKPAKPKAKKAA